MGQSKQIRRNVNIFILGKSEFSPLTLSKFHRFFCLENPWTNTTYYSPGTLGNLIGINVMKLATTVSNFLRLRRDKHIFWVSHLAALRLGNLAHQRLFFICYLAAPQPNLGHRWGGSLDIWCWSLSFTYSDPKNTRSIVTRLSPKAWLNI